MMYILNPNNEVELVLDAETMVSVPVEYKDVVAELMEVVGSRASEQGVSEYDWDEWCEQWVDSQLDQLEEEGWLEI